MKTINVVLNELYEQNTISAVPFEFPGFEGFKFATGKTYRGWLTFEVTTGRCVNEGSVPCKTKKDSLRTALDFIRRNGVARLREVLLTTEVINHL